MWIRAVGNLQSTMWSCYTAQVKSTIDGKTPLGLLAVNITFCPGVNEATLLLTLLKTDSHGRMCLQNVKTALSPTHLAWTCLNHAAVFPSGRINSFFLCKRGVYTNPIFIKIQKVSLWIKISVVLNIEKTFCTLLHKPVCTLFFQPSLNNDCPISMISAISLAVLFFFLLDADNKANS